MRAAFFVYRTVGTQIAQRGYQVKSVIPENAELSPQPPLSGLTRDAYSTPNADSTAKPPKSLNPGR